ncbi:MAG: hypothetical protein QG573_1477 [Acidobacteriota bacterium]|nr:hypothetical protein [Acidobacteriota bacterium]
MHRKTSSFIIAAALIATALLPLPAAAGVLTNNCVVGDRPAATLLFPYFEVDLTNPSGRTTLISINNRDTWIFPVLARVTIWTDWGIPTAAFTLYLRPNDVQTVNLRDLFNTGLSPITGPGAEIYSGCDETLGGSAGAPVLLRAAHTGQSAFGSCFSSGRLGPNIATGYVTVDHVLRCRDAAGLGSDTPVESDYFGGATPFAGNDNVLWGDWMIVTPSEAFASGNPAVHIQADPDFFGAGDYTFYGRYHGFDGSDRRRPLPSSYSARFLNGGSFTGGTKLIVWRDTRSADTGVVSCGSEPDWVPLGERRLEAHDETLASTDLGSTTIFDLATQRTDITDVSQPYTFGLLEMNLNLSDDTTAQAWVGVEASAAGQYSIGFPAIPMNDLCALVP